ncbi:SPW repeat domain-containing protein [Microvirga massiliensis]|uniref:SPW repeat domain-containing protein n=1 Tax=Microvirga massiliensis TaxID=1033741 RepID=UPI0018CF4195|nr:SPW repeat protein [Microvirga massiliensis]
MAPYLFGFADGGAAQWVPMAFGSLRMDYELSLTRLIPLPAHLAIDAAGGLLLLATPWLFGFADQVMWPHVIVGIMEIGVALMTRTVPDTTTMAERQSYS